MDMSPQKLSSYQLVVLLLLKSTDMQHSYSKLF